MNTQLKSLAILVMGSFLISCEKQLFNNPFDPRYRIRTIKRFEGSQIRENIKLTWEKTDNVKTAYVIERKAPGDTAFSVLTEMSPDSSTIYYDTLIITDTTYYYRIFGRSGENNSDYSPTGVVETVFPKPSNMTAQQISDTEIMLSWKDNSDFEKGFTLERRLGAEDFLEVARLDSNATAFTDSALTTDTHYSYRVRAFSENNVSKYDYSDSTQFLFPAPTDLVATLKSPTEAELRWTDNNPFEVAFKIERKTREDSFVSVAEVGADVTSFVDFGLTPGVVYFYRVKAMGETTESAYSNLDSVWVGYTFFRYYDSGDFDHGHSVRQTSDGGYIVTGYSTVGFSSDVWIIKTDASGNEQWGRFFGGEASDKGFSVQQTTEGGFIVVGYTGSYGSEDYDVWLIKTDSEGNEQWNRTYGDDLFDYGHSVHQSTDGGFLIAGIANAAWGDQGGDGFIIKTDVQGHEVWNSLFDKSSEDILNDGKQTSDGGYVFVGSTKIGDTYNWDVWLIKTDEAGNKVWDVTFDGEGHNDWGYSVQETAEGGYILSATRNFSNTAGGAWIIKTNGNGIQEWEWNNRNYSNSTGYSVRQTSDGGYVCAGSRHKNGWDVWVTKLDNTGHEEWYRTYGGEGDDEWGTQIRQTEDSGFIIVGNAWRSGAADIVLIKTDPEGNIY